MEDRGAHAIGDLDSRRGWARIRALVTCMFGVLIFALSAAAFVMIGFAAAARMWSWVTGTSFLDAPVWSWAPGGAGVLGALAVVVSFVGAFWYFWRGASRQVLKEVDAHPLAVGALPVVTNVVEALSIGIGRPAPAMYVTDDPAPNALSLRSHGSRVLVITSGCSALPRDELEALCAHEFGHLWANDAHWVTSGMVALARARRFGSAIVGAGLGLLVLVLAVAHYADIVLWSAGITSIALLVLGTISRTSLRTLERGVRRNADEIADVAAIKLAKNPQSLGAVCSRLAANPDRVSPVGWRSELMWFEAVETVDADGGAFAVGDANVRSHRELLDRAVKAYGAAHTPLPAEVAAMRDEPAR